MRICERKIGIVGCGQVGMSYAFSLVQSGICDKLVLIDLAHRRIEGEAEDLGHGACFLGKTVEVYAGDYSDLGDADLVVITAGAAQEPKEDRMALLQRNQIIMEDIVPRILKSGFSGLYLVVTNPVDIMTRLVHDLSGAPCHRVIGSGTILDTARLRYLLGNFFSLDPKNIHAYVLGEHGDSEFVPWSGVNVASKWALDICRQNPNRFPIEKLFACESQTRNAAYRIIEAKGATNYGIATALTRLTEAIFANDASIFTLSCCAEGNYDLGDVYIGLPAVIGKDGIRELVCPLLSEQELQKLHESARYLDTMYQNAQPHLV